jgi:myo-inositol-1(or 4)-monophosphatase
LNDYCALLHRLADAAGTAILPHYRTALVAENKLSDGGFDPVTAADRAAEQAMRVLLAEVAPDHGIIGEEFGRERDDAENVWVAVSEENRLAA